MRWEAQLSLVSEVIDEWLALQRAWMYLEPIFSSPDILQQLPQEGKKYSSVDRIWRKVSAASKDTSVAGLWNPHTNAKEDFDPAGPMCANCRLDSYSAPAVPVWSDLHLCHHGLVVCSVSSASFLHETHVLLQHQIHTALSSSVPFWLLSSTVVISPGQYKSTVGLTS